MVDRATVLNSKALSLLWAVNEQKVKCYIFRGVNVALILTTFGIFFCWRDDKKSHLKRVLRA